MSKWRPERRGPGRAEWMFVEMDGARFELLAYTCDTGENRLASGFENLCPRPSRSLVDQVGEATNLDESKALAEAMVRRPRSGRARIIQSLPVNSSLARNTLHCTPFYGVVAATWASRTNCRHRGFDQQ
jgi:hypothetical protein